VNTDTLTLPSDADEADAALRRLATAWAPPRLRYIPDHIHLSAKQELFLALTHREAFFGGAAGPGKSTALLAGALQYADVPGYSALILRRTYADLALPGALMDMAHDWLGPTDARWNASRVTWIFPSGATVTFGHLEHEEQKRRYASARFHFIAFDELTQFTESQYTFLFSRLRRPAASTQGRAPDGTGAASIPLRMRSASNPGGPGHPWVKRRLVDEKTRHHGAAFIPAKLIENPHLDVVGYAESLEHVAPVDRERLLRGDWDVTEEGVLFRATLWLADRYLDEAPPIARSVRHWDFAATEASEDNKDPDWTVGTRLGVTPTNEFVVLDVQRFRADPGEVERRVLAVAQADGRETHVGLEQEPGSAGKSMVKHFSKDVLKGFVVHYERPTGSKLVRAIPVASAMSKGLVSAVRGRWLPVWLDELDGFKGDDKEHDDQVDSLAGAHAILTRGGIMTGAVPRGRVPTRLVQEDPLPVRNPGRTPAVASPDAGVAAPVVQGRPATLDRTRRRVEVRPGGTRPPGAL
jgi:predicted phage terminase large subunit-like protein